MEQSAGRGGGGKRGGSRYVGYKHVCVYGYKHVYVYGYKHVCVCFVDSVKTSNKKEPSASRPRKPVPGGCVADTRDEARLDRAREEMMRWGRRATGKGRKLSFRPSPSAPEIGERRWEGGIWGRAGARWSTPYPPPLSKASPALSCPIHHERPLQITKIKHHSVHAVTRGNLWQ